MPSTDEPTARVPAGVRLWLLVDHDRSESCLGLVNVGDTERALQIVDAWVQESDLKDWDDQEFLPAYFAPDSRAFVEAEIVVDSVFNGGLYRDVWVTVECLEVVVT